MSRIPEQYDADSTGERAEVPPNPVPTPEPAVTKVTAPEKAASEKGTQEKSAHEGKGAAPKGNPVGWSALLIAVVAVATQAVFLNSLVATGAAGGASLAYNPAGLLWDSANGLASLLLVIVLISSIAAVVVAIVALFGKRRPRWISWVSIGAGLAVLIGTVAFWQAAATL